LAAFLKNIFCLLLLFCGLKNAIAQDKTIQIRGCFDPSASNLKLPLKFPVKINITDSLSLQNAQRKILNTFWEEGYLEASFESQLKDSLFLCFLPGKKFDGIDIQPINDSTQFFLKASGAGWPSGKPAKKSLKKYALAANQFLTWAENNGYPFAECGFDSLQVKEGRWLGKFYAKTNQPVKIDSIIIKGNAKISRSFFYNTIRIRPGQIYNEDKIKRTGKALKQLDFLKERTPFQVVFTKKYSKLVYVLDPVKANQIDGYLGFLPDEETGKLSFLGQIKIKLVNTLGKGELLDLDWRGLPNRTRDLKGRFAFPFVLKSPFGAEYNLRVFQRDTLFTDVNQELGINYFLGGTNTVKVFYKNRNNSIVSDRTVTGNDVIGGLGSVRIDSYGLMMRLDGTDNRLTPKKGGRLLVSGSFGNRKVKKTVGFANQTNGIDSTNLETIQINLELNMERYFRVSNRNVLLLGLRAASFSGNRIFFNEALLMGGLNSLRGFDEESIYASTYAMGNVEWRFLLDKSSFLFGFVNQAFYELALVDKYIKDEPTGFGIGINFETKPGIFSLTYALGKQLNNAVSFRAAKVHFGIVSTF
jgi:outer membrane protein assembly factor BamA